MKQKNIFSRFMAVTTDLVITLIPLLVWDLIIFIILAGFLPATVMTFLDDTIRYIIFASFVITNPFITYVYGKTLGQTVYDIRILNTSNKKASSAQRMLREMLGGLAFLGCFYIYHGIGIPIYIMLNLIVILLDKYGRGIVDFICRTKPVSIAAVAEKAEDLKKKAEDEEKEELPVLERGKSFYHYDLHAHSKYSIYGMDTVEEIFQKASALGIQVLSITDRFSVKANFEAEVLSKPYGISYIPGIEMDCEYKGYPLTILGYGIDYKDPLFVEMGNEHLRLQRKASAERIEKFKEVSGIDMNLSRLVNQTTSGIVTPEMLINEVLKNPLYEDVEFLKPYREDEENAFQHLYADYFAPKKECYVEAPLMTLQSVLETIKATKGISILAYPKKSCGDDVELLKEILSQGVEGMEIFSAYHEEEDIRRYLKVARDCACFVSCGSDYYGDNGLMIQLGDSKAESKYEKLLAILINRCLTKSETKVSEKG